ncbi:gustatory receptor for bitter taste 93a [Lucilia sericata]|uniref:gustatory receptor for bitter taste 93a n=1 Tax=Lucilia sericata TaxID=13632 RepID=UPI0018A836DC|nr:gustatory receptor for bitter taste 93a [Lucilia sericata]
MTKIKVKRIEQYSLWILLSMFEYGRALDIIDCRLDRKNIVVYPGNKWVKIGKTIVHFIIIIAYWDVMPSVYFDFQTTPSNFLRLFSIQQIISVAIFSTALLILRVRDNMELIKMINRFINLNKGIAEITNKNTLFCKQFLILSCLKGIITILGYVNELPTLLDLESLNLNKWFSITIGVFLWLGSMFVLDACYIGFLIMSLMYGNLGSYLQTIITNMKSIECGNKCGTSLSNYHRLRLVCDYSDKLDSIDQIYSSLYRITKGFVHIFQWPVLYYIYYNFMVIFLLLNHSIWQYIRDGYVDIIKIFMVIVKISNLALIIMCANHVVDKSEIPNQLNLDIVCSDIDMRWDISVERFLSQRKAENLEINILGFFTLNNQFILLILSAIISYLFLIIQFGMTGGL